VIALAWLASWLRRPGGRGESAGFRDHYGFFAHNAVKRWWSPAPGFRRSPKPCLGRPQVPGRPPGRPTWRKSLVAAPCRRHVAGPACRRAPPRVPQADQRNKTAASQVATTH